MKRSSSSPKTDADTTIQELKDARTQFCDERGWSRHHTPRNLSISIAIEAAELMEHFQWGDYSKRNKQEIASELADILSYTLSLADKLEIDLSTAFRDKLEHVKKKYPVEIFNPDHDDKKAYNNIKKSYRQNKTT